MERKPVFGALGPLNLRHRNGGTTMTLAYDEDETVHHLDRPANPMLAQWERFKGRFAEAMDDASLYTLDDLEQRIATRRAFLFAGKDAAVIAETVDYPGGAKAMQVLWACGDLEEIVSLAPGIEAMARMVGCTKMIVEGQKGWERVLRGQGYRFFSVTIARSLGDEQKKTTSSRTRRRPRRRTSPTDLNPYQDAARASGMGGADPRRSLRNDAGAQSGVVECGRAEARRLQRSRGLLDGVNYDRRERRPRLHGQYRDLFSSDVIDPERISMSTREGEGGAGCRRAATRRFMTRASVARGGDEAVGAGPRSGGLLSMQRGSHWRRGDAARYVGGRGQPAAQFAAPVSPASDGPSPPTACGVLDTQGKYASQEADLENPSASSLEVGAPGRCRAEPRPLRQTINTSGTSTSKTTGSLGSFLGDYLLAAVSGGSKLAGSGG